MTCIHIEKVRSKISNLTTYKQIGPFLTPSEVKRYTHGSIYNSSEDEIRQFSDYYKVIDEKHLKDQLEDIESILSECDCLEKLNSSSKIDKLRLEEKCDEVLEELNSIREEKEKILIGSADEKLKQKEIENKALSEKAELEKKLESFKSRETGLIKLVEDNENKLSLIKEENSDQVAVALEKLRINYEKKETERTKEQMLKEKLDLKEEKLKTFVADLGVASRQLINLRRCHEKLTEARKSRNRNSIENCEDSIATVEDELLQKGISSENILKIFKQCGEIAEIKVELSETWQIQQSLQAYIEIPPR